jgi:hypothetical protein
MSVSFGNDNGNEPYATEVLNLKSDPSVSLTVKFHNSCMITLHSRGFIYVPLADTAYAHSAFECMTAYFQKKVIRGKAVTVQRPIPLMRKLDGFHQLSIGILEITDNSENIGYDDVFHGLPNPLPFDYVNVGFVANWNDSNGEFQERRSILQFMKIAVR